MTAPSPSRRAEDLRAFHVMEVVRAAAELDARRATDGDAARVCHLEVGQPSHPLPAAVATAAAAALSEPLTYTEASGLPALRSGIAALHVRRGAPEVSEDRVAVTTGASAGCVLAVLAAFDPGDTLAVFEPGYPCHANIARVLGLDVVTVHLDASTAYLPTVDHLEQARRAAGGRLHGVVLASPVNPTGATLDRDRLGPLLDWCADNGCWVLSDEIYHGITDEPVASAAGADHVVVVQSFSKYFCLTGWRVGWLVLPPPLVGPVERLTQNLYLAPPTPSQLVALAALDATDEMDARAEGHRARRTSLVDALLRAGVHDIAPARGAFYVWADLSGWGDSTELARTWLEDLAVACTPGTDFDAAQGRRYVRFSVAGSDDEVAEATGRLVPWLAENRR